MAKLGITLETDKNGTKSNHIKEREKTLNRDMTTMKRKFHTLVTENHTLKKLVAEIQLNRGNTLTTKNRPVPIQLQPAVEKESEILKKQRHLDKAKNIL